MRIFAIAAMASLILMPPLAPSAVAAVPQFTTILLEKVVDRPPDQVWARIGPLCAISRWENIACRMTAGNGVSVGTSRHLGGGVDEMIVGRTDHSYTYVRLAAPASSYGTLAVEPMDRGRKAKIVYTLFYAVSPLISTEAARADRQQRAGRIAAALDKMKEMAEAP